MWRATLGFQCAAGSRPPAPRSHLVLYRGTKTLAFELCEHLGFGAPSSTLAPTGYRSNILELERGFDELEPRGEIGFRLRLFAVQARVAPPSPPGRPARTGSRRSRRSRRSPTRFATVLNASRRSRGAAAAADAEIMQARGRAGLCVEPTAATAAAAKQLLARRHDRC
jgi:threonine synthase